MSTPRRRIDREQRRIFARHEPLRERVIRNGKQNARATGIGDLEAVHRDVERPAFERRDQIRPIILHELRAHAELRRDAVRDVDLEARELAAFALIRVWLAALKIGAPA